MFTFTANHGQLYLGPRVCGICAHRVMECFTKSSLARHTCVALVVVLVCAPLGMSQDMPVRRPMTTRRSFCRREANRCLPIGAETGVMTFLVVHGFRDSGTSEESLRQAQAIRQRFERDNVVIVSWRVPLCPDPVASQKGDSFFGQLWQLASDYAQAVDIARRVGREIGQWMKDKQISPESTVISGHSLGGADRRVRQPCVGCRNCLACRCERS